MNIGIISDTHGSFEQEFKDFFKDVDVIWHAGDFGGNGLEFTDSIRDFKKVIGVAGNCDGADVRLEYPLHQFFECEGCKVLMTHIGGFPGHYDYRAYGLIMQYKPDIFVCGHSHILRVMNDKYFNMLVINPGAAGNTGIHVYKTALRMKIENGKPQDMQLLKLARPGGPQV
ncbi:MAG: metallophosphoesterase family protein [Bacteroidales bacterium]|nr:metallophosphoesterase family protein [Bacteroidales bacterium]